MWLNIIGSQIILLHQCSYGEDRVSSTWSNEYLLLENCQKSYNQADSISQSAKKSTFTHPTDPFHSFVLQNFVDHILGYRRVDLSTHFSHMDILKKWHFFHQTPCLINRSRRYSPPPRNSFLKPCWWMLWSTCSLVRTPDVSLNAPDPPVRTDLLRRNRRRRPIRGWWLRASSPATASLPATTSLPSMRRSHDI